MNKEKADLLGEIRHTREEIAEILTKHGFLESLRTPTLETILDYENKIKEMLTYNLLMMDEIDKIKELIKNPELKEKVERIMSELGAEKLEDISMFSSTILALLKDIKGE